MFGSVRPFDWVDFDLLPAARARCDDAGIRCLCSWPLQIAARPGIPGGEQATSSQTVWAVRAMTTAMRLTAQGTDDAHPWAARPRPVPPPAQQHVCEQPSLSAQYASCTAVLAPLLQQARFGLSHSSLEQQMVFVDCSFLFCSSRKS